MNILYFSWLKDRIGTSEEQLSPPPEVETIADLARWLATLSPGHAQAFARPQSLMAALDQEHVTFDAPLAGAREVAFFPPVTGG